MFCLTTGPETMEPANQNKSFLSLSYFGTATTKVIKMDS
jgi:hypothetical protein